MTAGAPERREPVTVVCVFNDPEVRRHCLDRSLRMLPDDVEYIPVDNTAHQFASAGAALNHGARQASNRVVAFAHQDVFVHSSAALERAAARLVDDPSLGLLGATGTAPQGEAVGRIRDRVVLLGERADSPVPVDSLDEVLVMATRDRLRAEPLTQSADLAWHAYAVEYGLRARRDGLEVAATDLPITHNSLTINLARLDEAHAAIAAMYPERLPVRTTCGTVRTARALSLHGMRRMLPEQHRKRYWWLRESVLVSRQGLGRAGVTLVDVRREIDAALDAGAVGTLEVLNVVADGDAFPDGVDGTVLWRRGRRLRLTATTLDGVAPRLADGEPPALVTGLDAAGVSYLRNATAVVPHVVGHHMGIGYWMVTGAPLVGWFDRRPRATALLGAAWPRLAVAPDPAA